MINFTSILWICQISANYKKGEDMSDLKEEKNENGIFAIGIPGEVEFNPLLSDKEKRLFGHIRGLSATIKGCFMSNRNLGHRIGCNPQIISNGVAKLQKYKYIKVILKSKRNGTAEQTRHIYIDQTFYSRYEIIIPIWNDLFLKNNVTDYKKQMEILSQIIEECRKNENPKKIYTPICKNIGGYFEKYRKEETYEEIEEETTISKDIVIEVSDETPNDLNSKKPRRTRPQYIPKQVRRRKPPVKNILPPYVKNIIEKWNSYPSTTTHKLDSVKPSKTIQGIHRYLIQLKTGKMSGLKESWIKDNKIPRSFLTRKWTEEELFQGI